MRQGGGEETQTAGGGGAAGEFVDVLPGLWGTAGNSHLVQVYGTGYDSGGRQLSGGGGKLNKILEELDADDEDTGLEGVDLRISVFLKAVIQAVLLLGSETWVLNPHVEWSLGSLKHRFAQRITGRHLRRQGGGVPSADSSNRGGRF